MRKKLYTLYEKILSKRKSLVLAGFFWSAFGTLFTLSEFGRTIEYLNARKLEFVVRDFLGRSPEIDPRIRIFAFDDKAIAAFESPELLLADWTAMLRGLRERRPKAILIDKVFGYVSSREKADLGQFVDEIAKNEKLAVGSFVNSFSVPLQATLDISRSEFKIADDVVRNENLSSWLPTQLLQVHGPLHDIARNIKIGQIVSPKFGSIMPWIRILSNHAIPHLGFFAASSFRVGSEGPEVENKLIPLDRHGLLPVNFTTLSKYYNSVRSMRSLLERARKNLTISDVSPGDIVILLPMMFTGHSDFVQSPFGNIPGGLLHATIASSILKNEWIQPAMDPFLLSVIAVIVGILLGLIPDPKVFWSLMGGGIFFIAGGGILLFAYRSLEIPWFFSTISFAGSALTLHSLTSFELRERSRRLSSALSGLVPKDRLAGLLEGVSTFSSEPKEAVVTVMFLDISNFSRSALHMQPKEVFMHLKSNMHRITSAVHAHGGTVDRTMGDGLLCFFGYSYDGTVSENHAQSAIDCAKEIQRINVQHCISGKTSGSPIWPFRIGINTTTAFVGDMGDQSRIDLTLIGSGVNLAQRFEAACDQHSVMLSLTTFDLLSPVQKQAVGVHKCKIKVKNQQELVDCIEIDPLSDIPDERTQATAALRQFLVLDRMDERWPVISNPPLNIDSIYGTATLVDFSKNGVCLLLPSYLAKNVPVTFELTSTDKKIKAKIDSERLQKFRTEVRWACRKDDQYLHGFLCTDLNDAQQQAFFALLLDTCTK